MNILMEISVGQIVTIMVVLVSVVSYFTRQSTRSDSVAETLKNTSVLLASIDKRVVSLEMFRVESETKYKMHHGKNDG